MPSKALWKHLKKGEKCKLCGTVSGEKKIQNYKPSTGCSYSARNPQLFYCWRLRKLFFLDRQGNVLLSPKWLKVNCFLCAGQCLSLVQNPKQHWCKEKNVTYFVCSNGTIICRELTQDV